MKLEILRQYSRCLLLIILSSVACQRTLAETPAVQRVMFSTAQHAAVPGQAITLEETRVNVSNQPLQWQPKHALAVVLRSGGKEYSAHAIANHVEQTYILQPGSFQTIKRTLFLPENLLPDTTTIAIETYPGLLALTINPQKNGGDPGPLSHDAVAQYRVSTTPNQGIQPAPTAAFDAFRNAISSYEPVYFDLGGRDGANARFQISFKYRLLNPASETAINWYNHLYLGYTQTSLWDLAGSSKPFVDTTYNPAVFWHNPLMWASGNGNWTTGLATGLSHRSNGKSGTESRSLNEAFIQPELNYRFSDGSQLSFQPKFKTYFNKDENPDYADYLGYVDWKLRWVQPNSWVITGLYQQGKHGRATTQLELAWPLNRTFLNMNGYAHIQYFRGYGQTLLNYRQKSEPQIRFGLAFVP